jgi:microcystin-dependent protein
MAILNTPKLALPYPDPDATADVPRDIQALAAKLDDLIYVVGELRAFALPVAPAKWITSGLVVAQTDYPELFAAIDTIWNVGGEGTGQFRAGPEPGRALVGAGQGQGLTNRAIGARWGGETVTLTADQSGVNANGATAGSTTSLTHHHNLAGSPASYTTLWGIGNDGAKAPAYVGTGIITQTDDTNLNHVHTLTRRDADAPHDNNPPSVAVILAIYAGR